MKKDISSILRRGNLTPKERVLLIVHNNITKEKEGKEILSASDKHALIEGWTPKDNNEVAEYNKYNSGWRTAGFAELEAQTIFLNAQSDYYRTMHLSLNFALYPAYKTIRESVKQLEKIKRVDIKEANEIVRLQREQKLKDGLDYDFALYQLAFELLPDDLQQDLKLLYSDVNYDTSYLDQEETVADLFKGKDTLTAEAKEKLAELVASRAYNSYAKKYQLYHYFAGIPLAEAMRYFLFIKGIDIEGDKLKQNQEADSKDSKTHEIIQERAEQYAKEHNTNIEAMLKEGCLKWLEDGLLVDIYSPFFNSKQKETYSGDTKHPHDEIFKAWLQSKAKAKTTLEELIKKGELKIATREKAEPKDNLKIKAQFKLAIELLGVKPDSYEPDGETIDHTKGSKYITGESLYNFKGDYRFVREQKHFIDTYEANLGIVYADDDPEHKGEHLDKELLISDKTPDGKPSFFSFSFLALEKLKRSFEATQIIIETEQDGERVIGLSDDLTENYKIAQDHLAKGYGALLAYKELFSRLSKTYEIDLTYRLSEWIDTLGGFIDLHNSSIKTAIEPSDKFMQSKTLKLKDNLFIDKDNIKPDETKTANYFKELEILLGGDF
jgi:hypothetical protein